MTRARARPIVRLVRFAVIAAVSLFAAYVIAGNVFLSTALFDRYVNGRPEKLDVRFERAWTLFPQHVHARKLTIRGRDSTNEWWLRFEKVEFDISLSSILKRRFQASRIRADGVSFLFRRRPEVAPSPEDLATLPKIPGFPEYTLRVPRPPPKPGEPEPPYRKITLDLRDLVLDDVRQVWVQHQRFVGSARVHGHFYFKPKREIELGKLHVALSRGWFSSRGTRVADSFGGSTFDLTTPRLNMRAGLGREFRSRLTLTTNAHGIFPDAGKLPGPFRHLSGPLEIRHAAVRIADGRLQNDSHIVAAVPGLDMMIKRHRVAGTLAVALDVERDAGGRDRMNARGMLLDAAVWHEAAKNAPTVPVLRAPTVVATADAAALELPRLFEDLHVVVDVPDGRTRDAGQLSRYFPPTTPAAVERGGSRAMLHFEAWRAERRGTASALFQTDSIDFRLARMRVRGRATVGIELGEIDFDKHRVRDAAFTLQLSDGLLSSIRAPERALVSVTDAVLAAHAPSVDLRDPLRDLDVSIDVPSAEAMAGGLLQAYLPKGTEMRTDGSRYALNIDVAIRDHLARGSFRMRSQVLKVALRDFRLTGQLELRARVHDWRWTTGDLAIDEARIEIGNVTMSRAGSASPGMSIASIGISATGKRFNLVDPLSRVRLFAWFDRARVHDPATLNAFLAKNTNFRFEGNDGTFNANLDLDVADHVAKGTLRATASNLGVAGKVLHLRGGTELVADFVDWNFEQHTAEVRDAHIELTNAIGSLGKKPDRPELSIGRLLLAMETPKLDLANPRLDGSDFRMAIEEGEIPDARALSPLLSPKRMVDIESGSAHVAGDLRVSHTRRNAMGNLEIGLSRTRLRLRGMRVAGDFRFKVQLAGFDPDRHVLNVSGTRFEMRNVSLSGVSPGTANWRGDIEFPFASLRLRPEMSLDTILRLDARDARPLLAILFEGDLPGIVLRLTDVPHLSASARLITGPRKLALLDLDARGGDVRVRGSYAVRDHHRRGALVLKKSFVSVGFRVDHAGSHLRFFGLNGWLRDRSCGVTGLLGLQQFNCPPLRTAARE